MEGRLVRQAFERCRENQVQAARRLGVTHNTLRTLLKRHGLLGAAAAAVELPEDEAQEDDAIEGDAQGYEAARYA